MKIALKYPEHIREILTRRYHNHCRNWLDERERKNQGWPIQLILGKPTEEDVQRQSDAVRRWMAIWQSWSGEGELIWRERRFRTFGSQCLPEKIQFQNPESISAWIGESQRWQKAKERYSRFILRWPEISSCLARYYDNLADYRDDDFQRLEDLLTWLLANPNSNLYPRQMPIAGLDTKWVDRRKTMVSHLLAVLKNETIVGRDFFQCCGLKPPSTLIRMRILDPVLRQVVGGLIDIAAPLDELARLNLHASRVYIIENLQTGLSFCDEDGSVVIMHLGYNVDVLSRLPWVKRAHCIYWGDLDTHGFAILHRARSHIPHLQSVLMDEVTLLRNRALWVEEKEPHSASHLELLTAAEQQVYQGLKQSRWGEKVRLEQERIAWDYACEVISCIEKRKLSLERLSHIFDHEGIIEKL